VPRKTDPHLDRIEVAAEQRKEREEEDRRDEREQGGEARREELPPITRAGDPSSSASAPNVFRSFSTARMRAASTGTSIAAASCAPPNVGRTMPASGSSSRRMSTSSSADREAAE